jgi:nucleoside-diphosphate-sugar epimerase
VEVLTPAKTKIATPVGLKPTGVVLTGSVIVLGANGRLGQACVAAFHSEGWSVGALARSEPTTERLDHVDYLVADALDPLALTRSVVGYDVIVNAVNVSYSGWAEMTPKLTEAVARAAASTGATVIIPGNIYHYGADMPATLSEATHASPTTALGKVRQTMERAYQSRAAMDGFQALILRAGDYLDGRRTGGWFDSQIANKLDQGKITYPGPLDVAHEWAYLPDFARAIVALAEHRETLPAFCAMGFSGHNITGQQLVDGLTATIGKHQTWRCAVADVEAGEPFLAQSQRCGGHGLPLEQAPRHRRRGIQRFGTRFHAHAPSPSTVRSLRTAGDYQSIK